MLGRRGSLPRVTQSIGGEAGSLATALFAVPRQLPLAVRFPVEPSFVLALPSPAHIQAS